MIIHRNLCLDNISIKVKKVHSKATAVAANASRSLTKRAKISIAGFDLAFCLKSESFEIKQSFNIDNVMFAPEIMSGLSHSFPVDVWGLGRIADQLMALVDGASAAHPIFTLLQFMTREKPEERPEIA